MCYFYVQLQAGTQMAYVLSETAAAVQGIIQSSDPDAMFATTIQSLPLVSDCPWEKHVSGPVRQTQPEV